MPIMSHLLTQESNKVLSNKTNSLIYQYKRKLKWGSDYNTHLSSLLRKLNLKDANIFDITTYIRDIAKVEYFGITCTEDKLAEAATRLVAMINHFSLNNYILATLSPLTAISLKGGKFCVISYLAIDPQWQTLVQSISSDYLFQEGGLPPELK